MNRSAAVYSVATSDVQAAVDGDEVAFARLVAAHHEEMARVSYAIVGEPQMADDAVQAAWVLAWRKLRSVRHPERIRQWLLTIVVNESRQALRRRRRTAVVELDMGQPAAERSDPSVGIARLDLAQALGRLSPDDRALLALRYVAGFDATEIGKVTGRTAGGTRVRLSRLTAQLRGQLSQ